MSRAKRPEIEELLTLLFDEIEPKDERVGQYGKRIETQLRKRLQYRIDILKRDWFYTVGLFDERVKRRIQVDIHTKSSHVLKMYKIWTAYLYNAFFTDTKYEYLQSNLHL